MPLKKSYDFPSNFELDILEFIEMQHLLEGGVCIYLYSKLRRLHKGSIQLRAVFNQRNTVLKL